MIVTEGLCKRYDGVVVVDDVSLTLPRGGITSIIGPNGAGKSTLLSLISRLLPMDAGTVTLEGLDVTRADSRELAKRLSILRQDNHMNVRLSVRDLVSFGRYPYSQGRLNAEDLVHVDRAIEYLDLQPLSDRYLDELSGGQRQRAFVAMVLCQDTDYVLLDEPLNSLDMRHARDMMKLLRRAADELGRTIVMVLHDINFAAWYSDHLVALKQGKVVFEGPPSALMREEVLASIYDMQIRIVDIQGRRIGVHYE